MDDKTGRRGPRRPKPRRYEKAANRVMARNTETRSILNFEIPIQTFFIRLLKILFKIVLSSSSLSSSSSSSMVSFYGVVLWLFVLNR